MGYEGEGGLFDGGWEADLDLRHSCESSQATILSSEVAPASMRAASSRKARLLARAPGFARVPWCFGLFHQMLSWRAIRLRLLGM